MIVILNIRKLEPQDLLKYFSETKKQINSQDFYETHQNFVSKYGPMEVSTKELTRIK
jgi:hypothetical protein